MGDLGKCTFARAIGHPADENGSGHGAKSRGVHEVRGGGGGG